MTTLGAKLMTVLFFTYLGTGALLQINPINDLIELDSVNGFFFYTGGSIYLLYWVVKRFIEVAPKALDIYDKWLVIRNKHKK